MNELLVRIARCGNVAAARCSPAHPCNSVVMAQQVSNDDFHLPEPWNGHIESAPLLFVSSNPAIGEAEDYPRMAWTDDEVTDYFSNRFGGGRKEWTMNGNRGLRRDGTYGRWSPFWSALRARASELFERNVAPGIDFALTEVVHCKSLREEGVREAADECAAQYLLPVIGVSAATIIVTLGKFAEAYMRRVARFEGSLSSPMMIGGRERIVAVLPHPNARMERSFALCFNLEDLRMLRHRLRAAEDEAVVSREEREQRNFK